MPNCVNVPAGQALRIPKGLTFEQAAALPEVFATAYLNLFIEARLAVGERVLLHAGASGVGTAGIQLCRMNHSPCFVTVGSDDKVARCVALGANGGVNRHAGAFGDLVAGWTDGAGLRRDSRSGRRRLSESESARAAHRRSPRDHRPDGRRGGRTRTRTHDDEAAARDRLDAARALDRGEVGA